MDQRSSFRSAAWISTLPDVLSRIVRSTGSRQRILMNRTRLANARLFDVQCEASDLSGSVWQRPRWQRVHMKGCKLTGAPVQHSPVRMCTSRSVRWRVRSSGWEAQRCALRTVPYGQGCLRQGGPWQCHPTGAIWAWILRAAHWKASISVRRISRISGSRSSSTKA